jgi:hypothetical protein
MQLTSANLWCSIQKFTFMCDQKFTTDFSAEAGSFRGFYRAHAKSLQQIPNVRRTKTFEQLSQFFMQRVCPSRTVLPRSALGFPELPEQKKREVCPPPPPCLSCPRMDPGARHEPRTTVRKTGSCRRYPFGDSPDKAGNAHQFGMFPQSLDQLPFGCAQLRLVWMVLRHPHCK